MNRALSTGPTIGSLSFRICLFFAVNPDECLTTSDIGDKFNVPKPTVYLAVRKATDAGWLRKDGQGRGGGRNTYWPGPQLLDTLGRLPR